MNAVAAEPGDVEGQVARALVQCRVALTELDGAVIPALHPVRRTHAQRIARSLARREVFGDVFVRDLRTLIDDVRREASSGRHVGWQADENHTRGGYETVFLEPRSAKLEAAALALEALASAIGHALDAASAARIACELARE